MASSTRLTAPRTRQEGGRPRTELLQPPRGPGQQPCALRLDTGTRGGTRGALLGLRGGHPHPTDQPRPAPDPLRGCTTGLLARRMDGQTSLGPLPPSAKSQAPRQRVQGLGFAEKGHPSRWHGFFCPGCVALINHFFSRSFCKCFSSIKAAVPGLRQKCWCFIGSGEHQHRITAEALILLRLHWMD